MRVAEHQQGARRLPARERVVVLLNVLKRETPVELPERWLKRA